MSHVLAFDTLAYAKKLKAAGFTDKQAEVQAEAIAEIIEERLATKQDILDLKRDMKEMETALRREILDLKRDMKEMETSLKRDMKEIEIRLKHDLTLRLGAMLTAGIAIVAALVKLL